MIKIGLDATVFANEQYTGIPRSVYEIIKHWSTHYPDNEYFLISSVDVHIDFDLPDNWHIIRTVSNHRIINKLTRVGKIWDLFILPYIVHKYGLDVYWGTNYVLPLVKNKNTKYVVTIYDLALFKFDKINQVATTIKQKLLIKPTLANADTIVAISNATKNDIIELFGVKENKIEVSYCGKSDNKSKAKINKKEINQKLLFDDEYFLFISTIEPRKNLITIVKAFEKYLDKTKNNTKLVIAGKKGWNCDDIYETIENSKYRDSIIMPGFISNLDKQYLLENAKLFLYPSIYEGFGLPILEAFSYNLPVITANNSSLPEVGGDAAFYIEDTFNDDELSELMIKVYNLSQEEITNVIDKEKEQLNKFSWQKNSNEMMDIIYKTLKSI